MSARGGHKRVLNPLELIFQGAGVTGNYELPDMDAGRSRTELESSGRAESAPNC